MVSVVIPTYNEEKALPRTLRELLRQPGDHEVIVVNGGSTDRTLTVLAEFSFSEYPSPLTSVIDSSTSNSACRWCLAPSVRMSGRKRMTASKLSVGLPMSGACPRN
jgi:glycosyltransferase involved in cell wall biosynthesis